MRQDPETPLADTELFRAFLYCLLQIDLGRLQFLLGLDQLSDVVPENAEPLDLVVPVDQWKSAQKDIFLPAVRTRARDQILICLAPIHHPDFLLAHIAGKILYAHQREHFRRGFANGLIGGKPYLLKGRPVGPDQTGIPIPNHDSMTEIFKQIAQQVFGILMLLLKSPLIRHVLAQHNDSAMRHFAFARQTNPVTELLLERHARSVSVPAHPVFGKRPVLRGRNACNQATRERFRHDLPEAQPNGERRVIAE